MPIARASAAGAGACAFASQQEGLAEASDYSTMSEAASSSPSSNFDLLMVRRRAILAAAGPHKQGPSAGWGLEVSLPVAPGGARGS